MELSKVLEQVRKAAALAADPRTPEHEAKAAQAMADRLMEKYAIEEWQIQARAPKSFKPDRIKVDIGEADSPFLNDVAHLATIVSRFCRCESIWMVGSGYKYEGREREEYCWVYGYESDLKYFELLFTSLYLHMTGALMPKPDVTKSLDENAYDMRNAGLNWIDIAQAYGWREVPRRDGEPKNVYVNENDPTGKRVGWSTAVGRITAAYQREIKRRGEKAIRIAPNGAMTFRRNAIAGYMARISQRLREIKEQRGTGTEIMLRDKRQNIDALIAEMHGELSYTTSKSTRYNAEAYSAGVRHANTASLNPEAGAAPRTAIQ